MIMFTSRRLNVMIAIFIAGLAGFIISFSIEYMQAFLPSRDSSMRDLIANTAGTFIECIGYCVATVQEKQEEKS
jgi:VanZ family protein